MTGPGLGCGMYARLRLRISHDGWISWHAKDDGMGLRAVLRAGVDLCGKSFILATSSLPIKPLLLSA